MEIATGYFAKAKQYSDNGFALVSIARTRPWFLPKELLVWHVTDLAPTGEIIGAKNNPEAYEDKYRRDILSKVSPRDVLRDLEKYAGYSGKDKVVLLCYEAPDKFCHRHIVARWLENYTGKTIEEINVNSDGGTLF